MSQRKSDEDSAAAEAGKAMDELIAQWRRERPDLDPSVMAVCGEIWRAGDRLRKGVLENLAIHDLDLPSFDVMLSLRRQGKGQSLSPVAMAREMMLSTSAMTNRLDRLENRGLIERMRDPNDRRGLKIALTAKGFALADKIIASHVSTEEQLLQRLTKKERNELLRMVSKVG